MGNTQTELALLERSSSALSAYSQRDGELDNETIKQPLREMVIKHFLSIHERGRLRCGSLPGRRWSFENQLKLAWSGESDFIGFEKDPKVLQSSIPWMPRNTLYRDAARWRRRGLMNGYIDCWTTSQAKFLNCDINDFFRIGRSTLGANDQQRNWNQKFRRWSCAWLDFTSCLCTDVEKSLLRLASCLDRFRPEVPVAITLSIGRETRMISNKLSAFVGDRSEFVSKTISASRFRNFKLDKEVPYKSVEGANMILIMGRLISTEPMTIIVNNQAKQELSIKDEDFDASGNFVGEFFCG